MSRLPAAPLVATVLFALASTARADDAVSFALALRHADALADLLADPLQVNATFFRDPSCTAKFDAPRAVSGADRVILARCLVDLALEWSEDGAGWTSGGGSRDSLPPMVTFGMRDGMITSVGPVAPDPSGHEPKWATVDYADSFYDRPDAKLLHLLARAPANGASAVLRVCLDARAHVVSRRIVKASGVPAFDKELLAHVAREHVPPISIHGRHVAGCGIVAVSRNAHSNDRDDDVNGEEGGVEGGVWGGVDGGGAIMGPPPPPPPPPPPAPPQNVAPMMLEGNRISGDPQIRPDAKTVTELQRAGVDKVIGSFKLCVDVTGAVSSVSMLKSTRYAAYDAKLVAAMHTWAYRPYELNGRAIPVCTAVTFIYAAPPPAPAPAP